MMTAPNPGTYAKLFASMPNVMEGEYGHFMDTFSEESANAPADL